jgi:hypothetical protein
MVHSSRWCRALTVVLALAVAPFAGEAQPAGKVPRLGILWPYSPAVASPFAEALRQGLREAGYVGSRRIKSSNEMLKKRGGLAARRQTAGVLH